MTAEEIYATPLVVTSLKDCAFYHTMDVPGHGTVTGQWDLRADIQRYLGGVNFQGKRVLEVGTASGFICFHMESQGAEVVAHDLSPEQDWDIVPYATLDYAEALAGSRRVLRLINNAYWLAHAAKQSKARVVHGTVYTIPKEIGAVDICTFGSILLHLRDPFQALAMATCLTRETVIVTDLHVPSKEPGEPTILFTPRPVSECKPGDRDKWGSWWILSPEIVQRFLGVLGFEKTEVTFHSPKYRENPVNLFTVVGRRTSGSAMGAG